MKSLDLGILHSEDTDERNSGRTVRALTCAIQEIDFCPKQSIICFVAHNYRYALCLLGQAIWLAEEMGFEEIYQDSKNTLIINGCRVYFKSIQNEIIPSLYTCVFMDHVADESMTYISGP